MESNCDFVRKSLELHLFFGRIMKEHSFFLELGFTPKDSNYSQQADEFRREFDRLLWEVVCLSSGVISPDVLKSGEVITQYTLDAERASAFYTGVDIPVALTQTEEGLMLDGTAPISTMLEHKVHEINQKYIYAVSELIKFKSIILKNVLSCKMFVQTYPLLIDHIMREAKLYLQMIQSLQNGIDMEQEELEQEIFWSRIMAEHSKFIRGLLDPTEDELISTANDFGNTFDQLTQDAIDAMDRTIPIRTVTNETLSATIAIRDFKAQGTQGLVECKIKSMIIPLLGDHTLREANHYLRLLKMFKGA